jgi:hypothetical protein
VLTEKIERLEQKRKFRDETILPLVDHVAAELNALKVPIEEFLAELQKKLSDMSQEK